MKLLGNIESNASLNQKKKLSATISIKDLLSILEAPALNSHHLEALEIMALQSKIEEEDLNSLQNILSEQIKFVEKTERTILAILKIATFLPELFEPTLHYLHEKWPISIRAQAIKTASQKAPTALLPQCIQLLQYMKSLPFLKPEDVEIVQASLYALRFYSQPEAFENLLEWLYSTENSLLIKIIAESLSVQNNPQLISCLISKIKTANFHLKRNIYCVFSESRKEILIPFFEKGLTDPNASIQYQSLIGLCLIESFTSFQIICNHLCTPPLHRKEKLLLLEQFFSSPSFKKFSESLDPLVEEKTDAEKTFLKTLYTIQDPVIKIEYIKECLTLKIKFDPRTLLEILEPQESLESTSATLSEKLSPQNLTLCRIQAWQLLIQFTQQHFPLDPELWGRYIEENYEKTLDA
ncbi:MAG: HEAT repeat domain-containing protein [Planctomycetota bacterium]